MVRESSRATRVERRYCLDMSVFVVPLVSSGLELHDAPIDDALGGEVAERRAVSLKALGLRRDAVVADPEVARGSEDRGLIALAVREASAKRSPAS